MEEYYCAYMDPQSHNGCEIPPEWEVYFDYVPDQFVYSCDFHLEYCVPANIHGEVYIRRVSK